MNVADALNESAKVLEANGVAEPMREASLILQFALNKDKTFLIAHREYKLSADEEKRFVPLVERRAKREPFQYISGKQEFHGLDFEVTPDVLIPRPETEMLVERAIEILKNIERPTFCEIGVGSGCISVSILVNVKNAAATALDISATALEVASRNAERHAVRDRITFIESDLFSRLNGGTFDLIVSNPPYVPAAHLDGLQAEVKNFEPINALTDGADGLSIVRRIVQESPNFLNAGGSLLLEIGMGQAQKVDEMFDRTIWKSIEIAPDFQGIPRLVSARLK